MSADSQRTLKDRFGRARRSFRAWRWGRPFWAGLLTLLAGLPIMYFPYANLTMGQLTIRIATTAGSGSLIIGVLLVVLGLTMWFQPMVRVFSGVAAILLALVSLVVSNFGGLVIGFVLGLIGGAMAVSWTPGAASKAAPSGAADAGSTGPAGAAAASGTDDGEPTAVNVVADHDSNGRHRAG